MLNEAKLEQDDMKDDFEAESEEGCQTTAEKKGSDIELKVIYKFCDIKESMVEAWKDHFSKYIPEGVQVFKGDIFRNGPSADAIVSPANSFGFMDGGIDMAFSRHFGWQMQERLQKVIRNDYDGEILVGQAAIITTVEKHNANTVDWSKYNEGQPIKYLISAPTMRVPMDVSDTANAYLAFRGTVLAVRKFNAANPAMPIKSVLCPGLGTAVGLMPADRCAFQMLLAYETFELGIERDILHPESLVIPMLHSGAMTEYKRNAVNDCLLKFKSVIKSSGDQACIEDSKYTGKDEKIASESENKSKDSATANCDKC